MSEVQLGGLVVPLEQCDLRQPYLLGAASQRTQLLIRLACERPRLAEAAEHREHDGIQAWRCGIGTLGHGRVEGAQYLVGWFGSGDERKRRQPSRRTACDPAVPRLLLRRVLHLLVSPTRIRNAEA